MRIEKKKCKHCQELVETTHLKPEKKLNENKTYEYSWSCPNCNQKNFLQFLCG